MLCSPILDVRVYVRVPAYIGENHDFSTKTINDSNNTMIDKISHSQSIRCFLCGNWSDFKAERLRNTYNIIIMQWLQKKPLRSSRLLSQKWPCFSHAKMIFSTLHEVWFISRTVDSFLIQTSFIRLYYGTNEKQKKIHNKKIILNF